MRYAKTVLDCQSSLPFSLTFCNVPGIATSRYFKNPYVPANMPAIGDMFDFDGDAHDFDDYHDDDHPDDDR